MTVRFLGTLLKRRTGRAGCHSLWWAKPNQADNDSFRSDNYSFQSNAGGPSEPIHDG
jgi:hypothetical protein